MIDQDVRDFLERMAAEEPVPFLDAEPLTRRAHRRATRTVIVGALGIAAAIAVLFAGVGAIRTAPVPADHPRPAPETRPVFARTATIGGLTVASPSDWYLVDYWGNWNPPDSELDTWLDSKATPFLEVTNFDAGLSGPVCGAAAGGSTRLPADGVAIFVKVGDDGRGADDLCGGQVEKSVAGTVGSVYGSVPYRIVMEVGPDAGDDDRATAEAIWRSLRWDKGGLEDFWGKFSPRYVLDAWRDGESSWHLTALLEDGNVELGVVEFSSPNALGDSRSFPAGKDVEVEGDQPFGVVTQAAALVEYHRAGISAPLVARPIDLPPSMHAAFDAYVIVPYSEDGPFEVLAIGAAGEVLGSNLPPLVHSERMGTLEAFGASWSVKVSRSADGYSTSSCVEPADEPSSAPCDRALGGGVSVQTFEGPNPAVFVTQIAGVEAIDVVADDGRVFHGVMLASTGGGSVVVVALEGSGRGRFVYYLGDGRTDEGRRPEAQVEWPDVGQVIGEGSFPAPDQT